MLVQPLGFPPTASQAPLSYSPALFFHHWGSVGLRSPLCCRKPTSAHNQQVAALQSTCSHPVPTPTCSVKPGKPPRHL